MTKKDELPLIPPINRGLDSRTNQVLISATIVIGGLIGFGEQMGVPTQYIGYAKDAVAFLGMVTGYHFRNKTTQKIDKWAEKQNKTRGY